MSQIKVYPKIKAVKPFGDKQLLVTFEDEIQKTYDCRPLLRLVPFRQLDNEVFFKLVHVDVGGYGISWNDEINLSEAELWLNGKEVTKTVRENLYAQVNS